MSQVDATLVLIFKHNNSIKELKPQHKNPMKSGKTVVFINPPISIAIGTAIMVEIKPLTAAPMPAICPMGCMANARIFPKINPMDRNCSPKNNNKMYMLGFLELKNKIV